MDVYGKHRVISQNAQGNVLRVLVEDIETGERSYRVISLP
ncbi:hypothetical protein SEA_JAYKAYELOWELL_85 [Mycobacterium phage Jaykayelowell]|uniref:Uncharacterized protein n=1 Tax=Mycobacterium phage Jaykayelowell TaxID=2301554 RepID=A0A385D4N9_9CAUD|nr:hypothetical protein SEA_JAYKAYELOWELL_85 [Mycobacterium phage Jaykayelowell]